MAKLQREINTATNTKKTLRSKFGPRGGEEEGKKDDRKHENRMICMNKIDFDNSICVSHFALQIFASEEAKKNN